MKLIWRRLAAPSTRAVVCPAALLCVLMVGFALRLPEPGRPPPVLYHDEAYNGLDAATALEGGPRLCYTANKGREPLLMWLTSGFVAVLGRASAPLRLPAAFAGTALIAATYVLGRFLLGSSAGLLAAALLAVAPWPVILSRVGFRAGLFSPTQLPRSWWAIGVFWTAALHAMP